jgi:fructokinase
MKTNKKPVIVGIGELLWDLLPEGRRLGGAPANFAYHAAAQGMDAYAVSAVGDDQEGLDILSELRSKALSTEYVAILPEQKTGTVAVELAGGMPCYAIHSPAAWDFIPFSDKLAALAVKADAVCFGTLAQRGNISAATIRQFLEHTRPDCLKVFDVNLRQIFFNAELIDASLNLCALLKISDEELPVVANLLKIGGGERRIILELMRRYKLKHAVLTKGKDGSMFCDGKMFIETPAFEFGPKVDTVGCGDSFTAILVLGLLLGLAPNDAMRHASMIAGVVCAGKGAMPEIPDELKLFLQDAHMPARKRR